MCQARWIWHSTQKECDHSHPHGWQVRLCFSQKGWQFEKMFDDNWQLAMCANSGWLTKHERNDPLKVQSLIFVVIVVLLLIDIRYLFAKPITSNSMSMNVSESVIAGELKWETKHPAEPCASSTAIFCAWNGNGSNRHRHTEHMDMFVCNKHSKWSYGKHWWTNLRGEQQSTYNSDVLTIPCLMVQDSCQDTVNQHKHKPQLWFTLWFVTVPSSIMLRTWTWEYMRMLYCKYLYILHVRLWNIFFPHVYLWSWQVTSCAIMIIHPWLRLCLLSSFVGIFKPEQPVTLTLTRTGC